MSASADEKEAARKQVVDAVKAGGFGAREVFVRVNAIDTQWHADDLSAAAHAAPDAILIPKISNSGQLEMIGQRLLDMGTNHRTRIWAMIETPAGLINVNAIGTGSYLPETWTETYATADIVEYDGEPSVKVGREFLLRKKNPAP